MNGDPFGSLREWGHALAELRTRVEAGMLDEAQPGLTRLIRYRHNWQVREHALKAARKVVHPTTPLLEAILGVVTDAGTYLDARILAVRALGDLIPRRGPVGVPDDFEPDALVALLGQQLEVPEAPVFHLAVQQAIRRIESGSSRVPA